MAIGGSSGVPYVFQKGGGGVGGWGLIKQRGAMGEWL